MVASVQSGTQAATIDTEHTLGAAVTVPGTHILVVNTANMANGDVLELRGKTKVLSTGAEAIYLIASYVHAQSDPVKMSIPIPSLYSVTFTLRQTAGVGRTFEWAVLAL